MMYRSDLERIAGPITTTYLPLTPSEIRAALEHLNEVAARHPGDFDPTIRARMLQDDPDALAVAENARRHRQRLAVKRKGEEMAASTNETERKAGAWLLARLEADPDLEPEALADEILAATEVAE